MIEIKNIEKSFGVNQVLKNLTHFNRNKSYYWGK